MAKECERLASELREKTRENLHLRMESSSTQSAVPIMANRTEMMRGEEQATKDKARSAVITLESGVQSLHDRLSKEENAKSEAAKRMEQAARPGPRTQTWSIGAKRKVHGPWAALQSLVSRARKVQLGNDLSHRAPY